MTERVFIHGYDFIDCADCALLCDDALFYAAGKTTEAMPLRTPQRNLVDFLADFHARGHRDQ
jgi:hypothetical protein